MFIKKILSQHRRDFRALFECEHCGYQEQGAGYDDAFFHSDVVPAKICQRCEKTAGPDYRPLTTQYPEGLTV